MFNYGFFFSIMLNGTPHGFFRPARGLRQSDLLSPFMFILGSEVLSRLLIKAELSGEIHMVTIARNALPITHLLFVDVLMIFSHTNRREVDVINQILAKYSRWSG